MSSRTRQESCSERKSRCRLAQNETRDSAFLDSTKSSRPVADIFRIFCPIKIDFMNTETPPLIEDLEFPEPEIDEKIGDWSFQIYSLSAGESVLTKSKPKSDYLLKFCQFWGEPPAASKTAKDSRAGLERKPGSCKQLPKR